MTQNDDGHKREPRPREFARLRHRILIPLTLAILVLITVTSLLLYRDAQARMTSESAEVFARVPAAFEAALEADAAILGGMLDVLASDASLRSAFLAEDTDALLAEAEPLFQRLRKDHRIAHFYFLDATRVCVLRVHRPKHRGDKIDRFTAIEAQKTQKVSWGVELGPLGTFTLRVVQPWYDGDRLIGYLELGEEIDHVLSRLRTSMGLHFVFVVRKSFLDRRGWEEGIAMLGHDADWDLSVSSVIVAQTIETVPASIIPHFCNRPEACEAHDESAQIADRSFRVACHQVPDAGGRKVAELFVLRDVTIESDSFVAVVTRISLICAALGTTIIVFFYFFLGHMAKVLDSRTAALAESEGRFRGLVESSSDWIWEVNAKGIYTYASSKIEEILGYKPEEVVGKTPFDLMPPEDAERMTGLFGELVESHAPIVMLENVALHKDGRHVLLETSGVPILDATGNVIGYRGIDRDITDRKRAQEAIKESEEGLRITLASIGDGVIATDTQRRVTRLNRVAEELTGWTLEEACGRPLEEVFSIINEETRAPANDPVARVLAVGRIEGLANHTVLVARDGTERAIADSAAPIRGVNGQIVGVVLVFRDVTEDRQHQKQKEQLLHNLDERVKELRCMYGVGRSIRQRETLEEVFLDVVALIPPGWNCPEITSAKIVFDGVEYVLEPFGETPWKQSSDIVVGGASRGVVEVYYLEQRQHLDEGPFMKEERTLIDSLGRTLSEAIGHKLAKEALVQSEAKYKTLVENLPQRIFSKNKQSVYVCCNEQYARDLGIAPDEIAGKTDHDFYPTDVAEAYRADDARIMASGMTETIEEKYIQHGVEQIVQTVKTPLKDKNGNGAGILGIFWDITERKQAEDELRRFNRQAVGREERMIELKREVNEIARKAGAAPPYDLAFAESGKGGTDDEG